MHPLLKPLAGLVLSAVIILFTASPASAHTEFESSSPADGAVVQGPRNEVVLAFHCC